MVYWFDIEKPLEVYRCRYTLNVIELGVTDIKSPPINEAIFSVCWSIFLKDSMHDLRNDLISSYIDYAVPVLEKPHNRRIKSLRVLFPALLFLKTTLKQLFISDE
jgi:hypothetical protein